MGIETQYPIKPPPEHHHPPEPPPHHHQPPPPEHHHPAPPPHREPPHDPPHSVDPGPRFSTAETAPTAPATKPILLTEAVPTPWPSIYIEAVIVCVDYADFLAWTLPFNRNQFDRIVVVTTPRDKQTQKLCEHFHVECVQTNVFYQGGHKFDKAAGINEGLKVLSRRGFVCQLDADIVLPPRAKEMIERSQPNPDFIYGIDRINCPSFEEFIKFTGDPELQYKGQAFLSANTYDMGSRLIREQGFVPIGFFQLWNPKGSGVETYSTLHDETNSHADVSHGETWPRNRRGFIPEIIALHIMSEDTGIGNNWNGRTSKPFKSMLTA